MNPEPQTDPFVASFVDRDMFMRFRGDGIGHVGGGNTGDNPSTTSFTAAEDSEFENPVDPDAETSTQAPVIAASLERLASLVVEIEKETVEEDQDSDDGDDEDGDEGEEDYGYVSTDVDGGSEDESEDSDNDDLGAEDGEDDEQDGDVEYDAL